jgi:hypothetical protein
MIIRILTLQPNTQKQLDFFGQNLQFMTSKLDINIDYLSQASLNIISLLYCHAAIGTALALKI